MKVYNNFNEVFQALTDAEVIDNHPLAKVKVPGMHTVKIKQVSEYHYFYTLCPMRDIFINYWAGKISKAENTVQAAKLIEKVKTVVNDIGAIKNQKDLLKKAITLTYFFEDVFIRYSFFKNLKRMKLIKWWVSWKRYQECMTPTDTMTMFVLLWKFNFDGVKKNAKILLQKIGLGMNSQSHTIYSNSEEWESYKKRLAEADAQLREHLKN